ncbi:protein downstream neighbor of Son-like isoform X2 [Salvelinus fontinalis]|uniref:protein downstream neighbor of Son-like isoform X2 n=1 Tax=Salvelinus fontinalis TaxID=8038 RepID=UPI002486A085|nr:protein downstream neighbor of Son-like isoform X2 [Salvelinus fontinalis]
MSQQAGYSPSFKRPAEILRMRRKKARSEGVGSGGRGAISSPCEGASISAVRPLSTGPLFGQGRSGGGVKRRNPFTSIENTFSSPAKKKVFIYTDDDADSSDYVKPGGAAGLEGEKSTTRTLPFSERLLQAEELSKDVPSKKPTSLSEDDSLFEDEDLFQEERTPILKSPQAGAVTSIAPPACVEYPADWSLKTRLLFTSLLPFSWAVQPRATEEAQGLTQHCRGQYTTIPQSIQDPRTSAELRCGFQQCLQFWQHPSLSWLSLFPRIGVERSFTGKNIPWAQDMALQRSLMSEWSVSLSSLYSLLKARLCPYFYVCSYQFTALFRASGLAGNSSITALLTPTTRGLREAMKAEGIEFTLPLLEERRKKSKEQGSTSHSQETDGEEGETLSEASDKEDDDDDDGGFSWLTEMGVQDKIKKPDNISIKLHNERNSVCLDHKPESVVCVSGTHTFTLINFLINCKSLVAGAGSQAGLPPTLLAPTAFRGATLHSLKARSVNVKTQVRAGYQDVCSLEVTGPIMPHSLHALTRLLRPAQRGGFSTALYTHEPTAVLNTHTTTREQVSHTHTTPPSYRTHTTTREQVSHTHTTPPSYRTHTTTREQVSHTHTTPPSYRTHTTTREQAVELDGCGLHPSTIQQLREPSTLGKSPLRQLHLNNYSYTWKS